MADNTQKDPQDWVSGSDPMTGALFPVSTPETSVDAPLNARRIFRIGGARSRVLTSVRPLLRRHVSRACMGVRGSGPNQIGALDALCLRLVFPIPSHRLLRHTFRSTFYILDDLWLDGYAVTAGAL
jgi:hypothetical protein